MTGSDGTATAQPAEDTGEPDAADLALDEIVGRREQEKHGETVPPQVDPSNTRAHGKSADPTVDPVTGLTSPAAVSAFVRRASRQA